LAYIFYNDEHPDGNTSFVAGHTKGVVAFDQLSGFWLVHSVPKYPPSPKSQQYGYPHSGQMYGQSFLCISLKTSQQANNIGRQLLYNRPYVYAANVAGALAYKFPQLAMAAMGK